MTTSEINPGICGFTAKIDAIMNGRFCNLDIRCDCEAIQRIAEDLRQVKPAEEISFKRKMPRTIELGLKHCFHAACPVPAGIAEAIEVEAGLALSADVTIQLHKQGD